MKAFTNYRLENGAYGVSTDNSFETVIPKDAEQIAKVKGIEEYNLLTVATVVNPVNFKRIEDPDMDQSQDFGGVNLKGNRIMEMDMDVAAGKIKMVDGRMTTKEDKDVCVISKELAELNGLKVGDSLQFNQWDDKENSKVYSAKIVGIYEAVQKLEPGYVRRYLPVRKYDFTDMNFQRNPLVKRESAVPICDF